MLSPTKVVILETHKDAEQPYHLVKEIFHSTQMIDGEPKLIETSKLTVKNIRDKGHKSGVALSEKEKAAVKKKEQIAEAKESEKMLKEAEEGSVSTVPPQDPAGVPDANKPDPKDKDPKGPKDPKDPKDPKTNK